MLLLLALSMLFGSYMAGMIPMIFTLSEVSCEVDRAANLGYALIAYVTRLEIESTCIHRSPFTIHHSNDCHTQERVRLLTILGSGILVGTALSVIIPEGMS